MALFDEAFTSLGNAMASGGEAILNLGGIAWTSAGNVVKLYIAQNPAGGSIAGWGTVRQLYTVFEGISASLVCLFFLVGWIRETIDIKASFNLENTFRFFIRFVLTTQGIFYGLRLIVDLMALTAALTKGIATPVLTVASKGAFTSAMEGLEGVECLVPGILFLLGGIIGAFVVLICAVKIMLSVFSRVFRLFVTIPFAPVALATFAGGGGLSQTGTAWIKTFFGYLLEILIIAMALNLSAQMFNGVTFFGGQVNGEEGWMKNAVMALLTVCEAVAPVLATTACVSGAEGIIRKCLGLNT